MFFLKAHPLDAAALRSSMDDARAGGFVFFEGRFRNHNEGREVAFLEYEAYEALALREGRRILEAAARDYLLLKARCVHRTGRLDVGDIAIWVGAAAVHREAAFAPCAEIVHAVKHRVPIWKREHYAGGGAEWVNCSHVHPVRERTKGEAGAPSLH